MRKGIIIGTGILILLLALAGTGSAKVAYQSAGADCGACHVSIVNSNYTLTADGNYFKDIHKFNGNSVPSNATSCLNCHPDLSAFLPLTANGSQYNVTHRYNETTLAAKMLAAPGCGNCHVNAAGNNFGLVSGTPTYLTSAVCKDCHKKKFDNWTNTMHRVMLTGKDTAQAMNLPLPPGTVWNDLSYVLVTKFALTYINQTGYFLAANDEYETETQVFINSSHAGGRYGTCARCHTTGYDAAGVGLPGINGTFAEPGIACERCHKPGGNGHQVVVNYSASLCAECHTGSNHGTGWDKGKHAPPAMENGSCMFCHSPFDQYKNPNVTVEEAKNVVCGVCHNIHDMSDNQYAQLLSPNGFNATAMASIKAAKPSFFNATASIAAGTDVFDTLVSPALLYPGTDTSRKDSSYGTAPINVTGDVTNVLCSTCHYRHGLGHIAGVNLSHGTAHNPANAASCIDCHMEKAGSDERTVMKKHALDPLGANSCGGASRCHTTSDQNLSRSSYSVIPVIREWNASLHNDKLNGHFYNNGTAYKNSSCNKCHSPANWNPANESGIVEAADFKGITCGVCHNIHDMGDSLTKSGKPYSWYNRDAIRVTATRYKANYTLVANTTELCGNCHSNIRIGRSEPGWASATASTPIRPHGFPAKDIFLGSWKQSSVMNFECIDCHMYSKKTNETGALVNDSEKITGHSFAVNETGLQNTTRCSGCHDGTNFKTIPAVIEEIQANTNTKWNATNTTVQNALANVKAYTGTKDRSRDLIARSYFLLYEVSSDASWGVHNPTGVNKMLDQASELAVAANASLGQATSSVHLSAGWNLVALTGTPAVTSTASVLSSVISNITVAWGFNATSQTWELYDPAMPSELQSLKTMVPGKGYWINAIRDCEWTI